MRLHRRVAAVCVLLLCLPLAAASAASEPEDLHLPDLAAQPPTEVRIGQADDGSGPALRFSFGTANVGDHAFDVLADPALSEHSPAAQCVRWHAPRICAERREVGGIVWHEPHAHFHFDDYARYELRRLDEDRRPVPGPAGLVADSQKVSFCLIDGEQVRDDGPAYAAPFYVGCFAGATTSFGVSVGYLGHMGISPGWLDIYAASRPGQQFPLEGIADGEYALVTTIDPEGRLHDADRSNNTVTTLVRIAAGTVRILRR